MKPSQLALSPQNPEKKDGAFAKGKKGQTSLCNSTYFPRGGAKGKARTKPENFTLATWYVNDSFAALEASNETGKKLDDFMGKMKELGYGAAEGPSE